MTIKSAYYQIKQIILVAIYLTLSNGCTRSDLSELSPAPVIYKVSQQADYNSLKHVIFNGGDKILLKRGGHFEGPLSLKRSQHRLTSAISVTDFGDKQLPRPIITANADEMGTIDIRNSGGWVIENLELINQSAKPSKRYGIYVMAQDSGIHKNFVIKNTYIHDVTGINSTWDNGGIVFRVYGNQTPTSFDNVLIQNNTIKNIRGVGMRFKSTWEADIDDPRQVLKPIGRHAITGLVIRGNKVSHTSRNAIVIASADAPLAEHNVMGPNISTETTGNTLYIYSSDDAIVQYNEAFGNLGPAADKDRGAYDADWNSRNITFRYNYSHNNNFAFAIMRRYIQGLRIHHNVSINERFGFIHYGFAKDKAITDVIISNNTFYSSNKNMHMFMNFGRQRDPIDSTFIDNIFVFANGGAKWGSEPTVERGNVFENNIVVGLDEPGYTQENTQPKFVTPGTEVTSVDLETFSLLHGYQLCNGSTAIGAGLNGNNDAQVGFWGNKITSRNIGAYQGRGIPCSVNANHQN